MISDEMKSIIGQIKEQGKMVFYDGASVEKIEEFEKAHGFKLPQQYREWLTFSDGGELFLPAGIQLYGVVQKPVINVDYDNRPDENYIVIGSLANGDPLLCEKTEETISIFNHEAGRIEDDEVYKDFTTFLKDIGNILGIGG